MKGIEPSYEAWKASVLPLNYIRIFCLFVATPQRGVGRHEQKCINDRHDEAGRRAP